MRIKREKDRTFTLVCGEKEDIKSQKGKKEAVFVENKTLHLMPLLNADTNGCKRHTTLKSPFSFFFKSLLKSFDVDLYALKLYAGMHRRV